MGGSSDKPGSRDKAEGAPRTAGRTISGAAECDAITTLLMLGRERAVRRMTVDLAQMQPGDKVLDVGCGTGNLTIAAKARVGTHGMVHGIDAAPEMIAAARRKALKAGADIAFQVALIEDIPFGDDEFDVVVSSLVLHHLPNDLKRRGFAEMYRVAKPGGRCLSIDIAPANPLLRHLLARHVSPDMLLGNAQALRAMLREAGFEAVEVGRTTLGLLLFARGRAEKPARG